MRPHHAQTMALVALLAACYPVYHVDTAVPDPDIAMSQALEGVWVLDDDGELSAEYAAAVIHFADDSILQIDHASKEGASPLMARVGRLAEFAVMELWAVGVGEDEKLSLNPWPRPRLLGVYHQRGDTLTINFLIGDDLLPTLERIASGQFMRRGASDPESTSDEVLLTMNTLKLLDMYPQLLRAMGVQPDGGLRYVRAARP